MTWSKDEVKGAQGWTAVGGQVGGLGKLPSWGRQQTCPPGWCAQERRRPHGAFARGRALGWGDISQGCGITRAGSGEAGLHLKGLPLPKHTARGVALAL